MSDCCTESHDPVSLPTSGWGCPMHPEVHSDGPGICPECGMALESADPTVEDDGELKSMQRRLVAALLLGLPVLVLAMGGMFVSGIPSSPPVQALLSLAVVFGAGWPLIRRGWDSLRSGKPNMFALIAIGAMVAVGYSIVALLAADQLPRIFSDHSGVPHVYFEAAVAIIIFVLIGQVLELRARRRTRDALRSLAGMEPERAIRLVDGREERIATRHVAVGDRLRVRAGDRVPVDGVIEEGSAAIDESLISGESMPVAKGAGDPVTGGSWNRSGSFVMEATAIGRDTMLHRIMQLVLTAQKSRAPIQKLADRIAAVFVPIVVAVALLAFLVWWAVGPDPALAHAVVIAIAVLIIACPCALGLATPVSIAIALGRGAREGVLVRDAASLQKLAGVDMIVVDKTGTLTLGMPKVVDVLPLTHRGVGADDLLSLAAALERGSDHPLAEAIVRAAEERSLVSLKVDGFRSVIGRGVSGTVRGRKVALGNRLYLEDEGVDYTILDARAQEQESSGRTVVFLALDGEIAGCLVIEDPIRPDAAEALQQLRSDGCGVVMLTGDEARVAQAVANQLSIDTVEASVGPEEKMAFLRKLQAQGQIVAMVGDGDNDAAALAAADVGIAMGGGSDVALGAAAISLPYADLRGVVRARRLARETLANVRQNLAFAFLYNGIGIPLAAGVLYPLFGWTLHPMFAAAAMSLSSVSVLANALRLRPRILEG